MKNAKHFVPTAPN